MNYSNSHLATVRRCENTMGKQVMMTIPPGAKPGAKMQIEMNGSFPAFLFQRCRIYCLMSHVCLVGETFTVTVPPGAKPGDDCQLELEGSAPEPQSPATHPSPATLLCLSVNANSNRKGRSWSLSCVRAVLLTP